MTFLNNLILITLGLGAIFILYRTIKYRSDLFSAVNLSKSFSTMGVLALLLIATVGTVVILLRG